MKHGMIGCKSIVLRLTEVLYVTSGLVSYLRKSETSTGVEKTTSGIGVKHGSFERNLNNTSTLFNTNKRRFCTSYALKVRQVHTCDNFQP